MTTRKRNKSSQLDVDVTRRSRGQGGNSKRGDQRRRVMRRQHLLETLETRQLLAGPQLIGIQPNQGELIVDGTVRDTAPRSLTFRFDEDQQIAPNTYDAIRITRAGPDGVFDSGDDIRITPGSVSPGETATNEIVVRFAEGLPDDKYRIDVFGFDDPGRDILGLRNIDGDLLVPRGNRASAERVEFDLRLGAQIEAIVPQPVVRVGGGLLEQRRNEILVYFNEDPLFVENDPVTGLPTSRSAENPRFYQLLLTEETVRTTDDTMYLPERVIYDSSTFTSRLIFAGDDINTLPGVPVGGGTFRLRIGTAVDNAAELIIEPTQFSVVPQVHSNLGIASDLRVEFVSKVFGESIGNREISFIDSGAGGLSVALDPSSGAIVYDFGGASVTVQQLQNVTQTTPSVDAVVSMSFSRGGIPGAGAGLLLPQSLVGSQPLAMVAVGDTLSTATDVGIFGQAGVPLSSLLISESIDPQTIAIQLPGANTDPGRATVSDGLAQAINARFGPDVTDGITEIEYNFQGIFSGGVGTGFPAQLNNITEIQKRRVREAISLWSQYVGVQFRETKDSGITFAVGTRGNLLSATGSELREIDVLDADLRIDSTFGESAMVFSSDANFKLNYGEDFFRKAMTGIGFLLGLEQNGEATSQTLMSLDPAFLNGTIDPVAFVSPVDPFISTRASYQQTINPEIDAQQIEDPIPNSLEGPEPVFPGNQDILHGSLIHRQDSVDVDLYRFEVSLSEGRDFGTLTVESFAERLADSSLLDTSLTLFKDTSASATTNFGLGTSLSVKFDSQFEGDRGNRSRIEFIQTDRAAGDTAVRVNRIIGDDGRLVSNAIEVDIPRRGPAVSSVTVGEVIDAINANTFASTLFQLTLVTGSRNADISGSALDSFSPIRLSGGGTVPVARNDDYFSSDSLLTAKLTNGVYYIGVSAAGNDQYDPTLPESGFGGRTQGQYELLVKFEPQVSQTDVLRDLDSDRTGVPGTAIDGDLDGTPGGVKNFWFQTRPLERVLQVKSTGTGIVPGQTMTVTGANGVSRRFEFVPIGGSARPGNVPVVFQPASSTGNIAFTLAGAINSNSGSLGVSAQVDLAPGGFANVILSGERTLDFSINFRGVEALGRTLFVDRLASVVSDGSLAQPFNNIASIAQASAFASALPGDIVRIVGNGGQDADISTPGDNFAYQVGISEVGGNVLRDGRHMDVPQGVTTMIDAGAAFKLRSSVVSVGSNNLLSDRSGGALQVLGAPRLLQLADPSPVGASTRDVGITELGGSGNVVFTSTRDRSVDAAASSNSPAPADGNWGGLIFRSDFDRSEGRFNREDEGVFLQTVNHADIRFGGGSNILINSVQQTVNPIQMIDARPTITFNNLTQNASAAMSASPDAFLETRFQEPRFQQAGAFTAEYSRVGPDIKQNRVVDNSINGLFIRTLTVPNQAAREITVAARIDDVDIVHYIAENVVIAGRPGGPIQDGFKPNVASVAAQTSGGGSLAPDDYQYRITFVDASGFESLPSDPTDVVTTTPGVQQVQLLNLPVIPSGSDYRTRRLYRLNPANGEYNVVAQLNRSESTFVDDGTVGGGAVLDLARVGIRGRLDGSLVIDPNAVVKFRGARIELGQGTQLLAEGLGGQRVVFTSSLDDRFGAGGSFDTTEDAGSPGGGALPQRGDWSGIYASPTSHVSLDHAVVAYGGGVSPIEGGQTRGFAALELQQASARVTNSRFEYNDYAQDGSGPIGRNGRLSVTPATIYARSTQPIIVGNQFVDNHGSIIDIDVASLTDEFIIDSGRQTGSLDAIGGLDENRGPLVRRNTTESVPGDVDGRRQMNGLRVRGGEISTATVLDDTDIAHVLFESIVVGNQVSSGGLTLKSRPDESLVVKMLGRGTPNSATAGTGITATGANGDIPDRIGGTVHVLGLPGAPVVLTSLLDDSVGAGRKIDGTALTDTNGDGFGSRPNGNDWRSLFFDGLSNDRNVKVVVEQEATTALPPGLNSTVNNAQILGDLAERLTGSDDELRLGFEVNGFISAAGDVDTYAFGAAAGTQAWIDLDRTSLGLDTMIEIVDDAGRVIARSDNSSAEIDDPSLIDVNDPTLLVDPLANGDSPTTRRWANGGYYDDGSTNLRDAGLRITLPGITGTRSDYFVRVRAASTDPDDIAGGRTSGAYQFQIRLQEDQEYPGSVVRHADIRYANHGVHVQGLPGSSPLVGEARENESADPFSPGTDPFGGLPITGGYGIDGEPRYPTDIYAINDDIDGGIFGAQGAFQISALNSRPQNLGDLLGSKTGTISVGGQLSDISDIDFYQIDIDRNGMFDNVQRSTTFDIDFADGFDRPDTNISVFYATPSFPGTPQGNPRLARLVLFGESSNVLDDLSSPIETELIGELLQRGSITENDPLIGPVALPAGSYFIAVTESGRIPQELTANPRVRRSPIDSGVRIFDDHIEVIGGATAQPPREREFVDTTSGGWTVTTDRSTDLGHERQGPGTIQGVQGPPSADSADPVTPPDFGMPSNDDAPKFRLDSGALNPIDIDESAEAPGSKTPTPGEEDFVADTIILEFEDNIADVTRTSLLMQQGLELIKEFNTIDAIVVGTEPGVDILDAVERLSDLPQIRYAEPDYVLRTDLAPNDPQYPLQWHYDNTGQTGGTPDADIDLPEAWDITTGTTQTVIAVIDSGMDLTHPDIVSNLWVNPGEIAGDGIDNDGNGYVDDINGIDPLGGDTIPQDISGHGTHVGGTTAAVGNNAIGVSGVNWASQIMPIRVCDVFCSGAGIIEALDYITMMKSNFGINIVVSNNSYGGGFPSLAAQTAIEASINAGIPFVTSAGNSSLDTDVFPQFPASYPLDGIISVASTDHNDQLSTFSNFGLGSVDLAAPGTDVLSTTLGGGYGLNSGTSMASPHVAGVVAMLAGFQPNATVQDLKNAVMFGADPLPQLSGTSITGARLNAAGALAYFQSPDTDNESIFFDRSEAVGTLTSNAFDLLGNSAADLPRLYFDYFVDSAPNDDIVVQAHSNEQPTPVALNIDLNDPANQRVWRQAVASLGQFAGNTGITIEFSYDTDLADTTAEGLYLDNFIVGFAERGEMVTGAQFGRADFTGTSSGTPGHYQLEVRPGTDYKEPISGGLLVERSLADDPKLVDPLWLKFTSGRGIARYETFTIDVLNKTTGLDETLTFQFQPTDSGLQDPSLVDAAAIPVPYSRGDDTDAVVRSVANTINTLTDYAFATVAPADVELVESFDTNDRHAEQTTLVAPAANQISDGDRFTLSDGSRTVTFEFSIDSSVTFGNIRIPYSAGETASEIARHMIEVINSGSVQGNLKLRASAISGEWDFNNPINPEAPPTDARVAIHGTVIGNFDAVSGLADAPAPGTPLPVGDDGSLILSAIFHAGVGDQNTVRTQGQVIVENNQITEARAIGIWSDPGHRGTDPEDERTQALFPFSAGTNYLRMPPVGNSQLGGVINFPELNDSVVGGLAPGLVAQNNIIDRAGYTGIKVDGDTRPFVVEWNQLAGIYASGNTLLSSPGDLMIPDGFIFAIDAGGTRVVFEFEDISGAPVNLGGSGEEGGDGFVDGHVPVYYRLGEGTTYNPSAPDPVRSVGHTSHEVMMSLYESIQGSILVSNGLVELVRPTLGPSLTGFDAALQQSIDAVPLLRPQILDPNYLDWLTPALYLEGVTGIYSSQAFQKQTGSGRTSFLNLNRLIGEPFEIDTVFNFVTGETSNAPPPMMPIAEAPQPLVKLVNNTVRGSDGTEGAFLADGSLSPAVEMPTDEPNDTIAGAVDTKLEVSHRGGYFADGVIGDNVGLLPDHQDVDFYKVELSVGDRLIVDIDTLPGGPTALLRVLDSSGIEIVTGQAGTLPSYLKPGSTVEFPLQDNANPRDSFVDFTALKKDTYYIGVSSAGNDGYEAKSLSARTDGTGGTGDYSIGIEVLAPRSFVFSLDSHPLDPFGAEVVSGNINGTYAEGGPAGARSLVGTTFTISQIPDYLVPTRPGDAYAGVNADGNRVTFEFTNGQNRIVLANGNINVPILTTDFLGGGGFRVPDIMRATAHAINGYLNNPAVPNHEVGNGPDGRDGPIKRVEAQALGGSFGDNVGIHNLQRENGCDLFLNIDACPYGIFGSIDFQYGFGHDRAESGGGDVVPNGTFTDSRGTTELYLLVENAAKIELSPEARAAGLKLGPDNSRLANGDLRNPEFATESDQLLAEQGIHIASGVSASILNNVVVNVHQSIVKEESSVFGFGGRIDTLNPDISVKQGSVVASGNAFQYDDYRNTQMRSDISWWVARGGFVNRNPALDGSLSTDLRTGPSNIAGGNSDFNFVVDQPNTPGQTPGNFITLIGDDLLEDGAAGRFTPSRNAAIIDSAVDSLQANVDLVTLNTLLGIPTNAIQAPNRDHSGQLRADEPNTAPPGGIGANVFKDRGALDLADFVGPIASLESPLDNDFAGSDSDPASSFVNRSTGVFSEFRILVQDLGDDSDPFVGSGIDDSTVVVSQIDGLRKPGANVALFENDRLLEEGIDYTFSYDESRGVITLTPLAGIWRNDRSYRIQVNNRDRTVLIAPDPSDVADGDQLSIIDSNGATLVFEFESGFSLIVPETITLTVPQEGTNAGGLSDGDLFQIDDGTNPVSVFEFNRGDATLPGTIPVDLPLRATPTDPAALVVYLQEIASNIATQVQSVVDAGDLDVDVRLIGDRVIIGGESGTRATTSASGLEQAARSLALQVPEVGVGVGGIADGDTFVVNNGVRSVTFEFDTGNGLNNVTNAPIAVGGLAPTDVALAIRDAVANSGLSLNALVEGNGLSVYLNLPTNGSAMVTRGQLTVVGLSRPATDGDTIIITPNDGSAQVTLEINRTDVDPSVTAPNVPVDITRATTANELAGQISNVLLGLPPIAGLTPDDVRVVNGGLLAIGGDEGLGFAATGSTFEVSGSPSVTGASTIQVFGPLLLTLPLIGGGGIADGSVIVLTDDLGNNVIFEFNLNGTQSTVAGSIQVPFDTFSTVDVVANNLSAAINNANIGITAQNQGVGRVSLGRIDQARVNINGLPGQGVPGLAGATLRRGIVNDGEVLTIRQGQVSVSFEFDAAVNGGGTAPGNVPVAFQRGSTVGDVAVSLAAAINNNNGGLNVQAEAELDANNVPTGLVLLNDQPGTIIDVFQAPTLNVIGVPGGATPINITPGTTAIAVKQALLTAINSVSSSTTLIAADRGGATFFVENGELFEGPLRTFYLPAVKDLVGNPIKPNREDNTTQFTILLPTVGLDYADAPDPRGIIPGQYPTSLANDGARHVITPDLTLGTRVDAEPDAQVTPSADGDDLIISVSSVGTMFATSVEDGFAQIQVQPSINPVTRDGDTITLTLGDRTVTLELDTDGIFKEENFAIAPADPTSADSVAQAIPLAISQSGLNASEVAVDGDRVLVYSDDEDGVSFVSYVNPRGNLNKGVVTPISVTVNGGGVLEAWIDFNADGDWNDPGEQIIERSMPEAIFRDTGIPFTRVFNVTVPDFASPPPTAQTTYARFRVSREGGLGPNGLALSGEVEDYAILVLPDSPPVIGSGQANRTYTVQEDSSLLVLDADATGTVTSIDDGILVGVVDPELDPVAIYSDDVGVSTLMTDDGEVAGALDLKRDGTFTFLPADDFNGVVTFSARVTDVKPLAPETELVNSTPLRVTINVTPVNDPPVATNPPVQVSATIDEDVQTSFSASQLIDPFFIPGLSANEADQVMVIDTVGSSGGPFTTELGGTVSIAADGRSVTYTPPADFSSDTVMDRFTYTVADLPGIGQLSEVAADSGQVEITIRPVNDAPRPGNDIYSTLEDNQLSIPIFGATGILANDAPGPQAEIDDGQTVSFVSHAATTTRGGTVTQVANDLVYTPPALFSGQDQFTYVVADDLGLTATGTVSINIGGINNPPNFIGINGDINETSIIRTESKLNPEQATYDLTTWFEDPEGDAMTFSVVSSNSSVVPARVVGNLLVLDFPSYTPGSSTLTITATDTQNAQRITDIPVTVDDTADPPSVIGTLDPLSGTEDQPVVVDLRTVFTDPDVQPLQYSVAQLGSLFNPTPAEIAQHPLVDTITFSGDQMTITLKPDQSGQADIKIAAKDDQFSVSDSFTLTVNAVPDRPVAGADGYVVPVGATLQVLNPANGLLRNDFDADGDPISIDLATVTSPTRGTLDLQANGTFTYTSTSGGIGDQDSFSYRLTDGTGRFSDPVTVTLTLNRSRYQNPLVGLSNDVNADGNVSAIDALRVINFLSRSLTVSGASSVPVSEIGSPPPDYYDANGDGRVSANDALVVINELGREPLAQGESVASLGVTSSFAAADTAGMPIRNVQPASEIELLTTRPDADPRDALLTGGLEIGDSSGDSAIELLEFSERDQSSQPESVDAAISLMMDEINLEVSDI